MSYFQWKWPTFSPIEGEWVLPLPLRTRVNVVNNYIISDGSGPHSLRWRECGPSLPLRTRVNVVNKYSYFQWKWPTFPPMEGECGPPLPLRTRVNVVNKYHTSGRSGPRCPLMEGRCGLPRSCGRIHLTSDGSGPYSL